LRLFIFKVSLGIDDYRFPGLFLLVLFQQLVRQSCHACQTQEPAARPANSAGTPANMMKITSHFMLLSKASSF
jgi:type II secretory ATPase GspE/PulE/Tfp pilus assembly ATPase PilB-like protein